MENGAYDSRPLIGQLSGSLYRINIGDAEKIEILSMSVCLIIAIFF
jgi:hypothetical protein